MHVRRRVATFNCDGDSLVNVIMIHRWESARAGRELPAKSPPATPGHGLQRRLQQACGDRDAIRAWIGGLWRGVEASKPVVRQAFFASSLTNSPLG